MLTVFKYNLEKLKEHHKSLVKGSKGKAISIEEIYRPKALKKINIEKPFISQEEKRSN